MPKGEKAQAQKAASQSAKEAAAAAAAEAAEAAQWADEKLDKKKGKKEAEAAAAADKAAKKAQADAQLRAEEEEASKKKLRGADKVAARRAQTVEFDAEDRSRAGAATIEARTVEDAIAALSLAGAGGEMPAGALSPSAAKAAEDAADDAHPERRMKAAFKRFQDEHMPAIKAEYPSLKMSQHLEMLRRKWDKAPENPVVAAARAQQQLASAWKDK